MLDSGIFQEYNNVNNGDFSMKISDHFSQSELECNCGCGFSILQHSFLDKLELARTLASFPFKISSWCRCPTHNILVGGSDTSSHLDGWAVDIDEDDLENRFRMVHYLTLAGFTRIGIGKNFIHVDSDPNKPDAIWFY